MQGRRIPDGFHYTDAEPGDYWRQSYGTKDAPGDYAEQDRGKTWDWSVLCPDNSIGTLGKANHVVEVHEDGTITVTPSILIGREGGYHGFLERGVWRSV